MMIENSQSVFLLADYSKLDRKGNVFLSNLSAIDRIITDSNADRDVLAELQKAGKDVVIASQVLENH